MLLRRACLIDQVIQLERIRVDRFAAHLAAAHTLAVCPAALHLIVDILPQAGAPVALHHVGGGDIADHAVDAAVARDGRLDIRDQVDQFLGGVGMEFAALPVLVQLGIGQQLVGIDLDLVRAEAIPQPGEILAVRFGRCAQQIGHPVQDDLEAGRPQQRHVPGACTPRRGRAC